MILDPNGMPILQPTVDNAETATFNDAFAAIGNALVGRGSGDNLVINGEFRINQREYVSGTSLSNNEYAFDRWKATTASTSLTFTAAPQGQLVTINSGGSVGTILERANVAAGVRTLSHTGTATMRVYNSGGTPPAYSAGPVTATLDGLADVVVEFAASGGTKTVGFVKLGGGSITTPYTARPYGEELALCQRYYRRLSFPGSGVSVGLGTYQSSTGLSLLPIRHPVTMRAAATLSLSATSILRVSLPGAWVNNATAVTAGESSADGLVIEITTTSDLATGAVHVYSRVAGWLAFDAEL